MVKKTQRQDGLPAVSSHSSTFGTWAWGVAKPFVPPWIVTGLTGVAGAGAHAMWAGSPWAGVGLTLGSVALTAATWTAGARTGRQRRLHSAITVASASAWTTAAALSGPTSGPLLDLYLMGGAVLALSWNIRRVIGSSASETSGSEADKGLLEKVGLARTKLRNVVVEPNRVTVPYELPAGELTNDDIGKALPRIASALDVPTTAIRVQHDPDSARKGQIIIVPEDQLKTPTIWPGPAAPGESVAVPLRIGVYDDGADLALPLLDAIHILVMGMTGSGKTEGAVDVMLELLTRCDVTVWLADAAKSGQDFQPLIPAFDWAALDSVSVAAMIAAVQAVIPARTGWLRDHGYRSWEPAAAKKQTSTAHSCRQDGRACGCPGLQYLLAWIEEAAKALRELGDDVFTGIAQEARSAGVSLVVSMQRASGYQLSTDTRASLPAALCFGVRGDDASFALPEEVLDAGANPAAWANRRKGYVYLVAGGVDEARYATPARTFWTGPSGEYERMAEYVVTQFVGVRAELDAVTAGAAEAVAGQLFTDRRTRALGGGVQTPAAPELTDEQQSAQAVAALVDEEDQGLDATADLAPAAENVALPSTQGLSTEEARELLEELIGMVGSVGPGTVAVKDVCVYLEQIDRDRSWVSKEMKRLGQEGRLIAPTGDQGVYRLLPVLAAA